FIVGVKHKADRAVSAQANLPVRRTSALTLVLAPYRFTLLYFSLVLFTCYRFDILALLFFVAVSFWRSHFVAAHLGCCRSIPVPALHARCTLASIFLLV